MMTLGSRFEALRAHTNLVVTISEEKQLFEENLKLVMLRVNAATSLLKWAREEGNPYLRSMVEKLYNITLMSATVQRQYAEQCCGFSKSLESILKVEQGLDAIRKQRNSSKEKMDNVQKQIDACKRKSDYFKIKQLQEELSKHTSDEEELAAELQVKFVKAEIFKMKVLKTAFEELTDAYSENADKVKTICSASTSVINDHPDVPTFLGLDDEPVEKETTEYQHAMSALAADLGLSKKFSSPGMSAPLAKIKSTSSPDLPAKPRVESKVNQEGVKANVEEKSSDLKSPVESRNSPESKVRKRLSKLPGALAANFHRPKLKMIKERGKQSVGDDDDNFVIIQPVAKEAPSVRPPALLLEPRRRSKSSIEIGKFRQNYDHKNPTGIDINKRRGNDNGNDVSDDDEYECPSYILPNSYNDEGSHLVRWSSDNALSKGTLPAYEEPADAYRYLWEGKSDNQDTSEPIYDSPYDLPFDSLEQRQELPSPPKKPLPETPPELNAPPKPKRSEVNEAVYINVNDVEKLLNEIYQESQLTEEVKPEVQKRALKKIRQEGLQTSQLSLDLQDSVIELTAGVASNEEIRDSTDSEPSYVNFCRARSPCKSRENDEQAHPTENKRIHPKQPPKVPARPQSKPEMHNSSNLLQEAPSSGAVQSQAKKSEDKVSKPKVPPRPVNLP